MRTWTVSDSVVNEYSGSICKHCSGHAFGGFTNPFEGGSSMGPFEQVNSGYGTMRNGKKLFGHAVHSSISDGADGDIGQQ